MSVLLYKQRFRQPNYKDTPACNYAHVRYIARRRGVLKNEGMGHGLFGKLEPGEMELFNTWKEVASHIYHLSKEGKNIYRSLISFERSTARELDLMSQKDWRRYVEAQIATIAEKNGIKIQDLGFACAVHDERHHPHLHVVFWDKTQSVSKNFVHKSVPNSIRKQLIKDTFASRIREYYAEKDIARDTVREITDKEVKEFEQYIKEIRPKEYERIKGWFETFDEDAIYADPVYGVFSDKAMLPLVQTLFEIKDLIPKDGRIVYKLMPPEVKEKIDELVIALLKNNAGLRRAVNRYIESKMNLVKLYGGNKKYLSGKRKEIQKEAERLIANRITRTLKSICQKERHNRFVEEERRYYTEQLIIELLEMFSRLSYGNDRRFEDGQKAMSTELSKQARKELYLQMKDKGIEP
ncbi:MAG: MobP3 family relaxase [Eubacteriales bacterium]|nr:MobP3 family relaxase [Eubacteriales bacterium]